MKHRQRPIARPIRAWRHLRRHWRRENGNVAVISALLITVLIGVLALVIDIGFIAGQRRFMQNGADAAALAAARKLAGSVAPREFSSAPDPTVFLTRFDTSDATVYATAEAYAKANQNVGLTTTTTNFQVELWYCVADTPTDYSGADCNDSDLDSDPLNDANNDWVARPPPAQPVDDGTVPIGAYMVRVRVSSTITTIFGGAANISPDASTSAIAVAMILGACPPVGTGNIWPFTVKDQPEWQFGVGWNELYKLWDPNPPGGGSWKQILDLSPAAEWCDNDALDYQWGNPTPGYLIPRNTPKNEGGASVYCARPDSTTGLPFYGNDPWDGVPNKGWNRGVYKPDPRPSGGSCNWQGIGDITTDVQNWAAGAWNGTLAVGMWMPTYMGGNFGANIGDAIYGSSSGAPVSNCTGTQHFFSTYDGIDTEHSPSWGKYKYVRIYTYDDKEIWNTSSNQWQSCPGNSPCPTGAPERVQLKKIYTFRIYEKPTIGSCGNGGTVTSSTICGRIESPVLPPDTTPGCGGSTTPSTQGNIVRMRG